MPTITRIRRRSALLVALALAGCRDSSSPHPPPAAINAEGPISYEGVVGSVVTPAPAVLIKDANGHPIGGVEVRFEVLDGGGTVTDGITETGPDGRAVVGSWTLGTVAGTNTLAANVEGLDPVLYTATASPGAAAALGFAVPPSGVVENSPITPAVVVEVQDQFGNRVPSSSASITLTVVPGSSGATLAGTTTVAAINGRAVFSDLTIAATALPTPAITSVTPAVITSNSLTRIQGGSFGGTPQQNVVLINGMPANIVSSGANEINVVAPPFPIDCLPTRNVQVVVKVEVPSFVVRLQASSTAFGSALSPVFSARKAAEVSHPIRTAAQLPLAVGQSTVLTTAESARCVELPQTGGRFFISVFTSNSALVSSVQYTLRGTPSSVQFGPPVNPSPVTSVTAGSTRVTVPPAVRVQRTATESDEGHARLLHENIRILRQNPHPSFSAAARAALLSNRAGSPPPPAAAPASVGIQGSVNEFRYSFTSCGEGYSTILGRTAWVGQHAIIVEDIEPFGTPPLNNTLDDRYAAIGQEFDALSWPIILQNFGNPLAVDSRMQNHGKIIMLFTNKVLSSGSQAFVFSCDFFPRSLFPKSNEAPIFYARPPIVTGAGFAPPSTPDGWQWITRSTIVHETKHIASYAERISRSDLSGFEQVWMEEGGARIAEELFARRFYGSIWKDNSGYAAFRCDLFPAESGCAGRPFVMPKHFGATISPPALYDFLDRSETRSVLCVEQPCFDASFYGSAWSMIRWGLDNFALSEPLALTSLTQTSTLNGAASFQSLAGGLPWSTIMGEWSLMLATDDLPGFIPENPRLRLLSWNLRDVFGQMHNEFPTIFPKSYPLSPHNISFTNFVSPVIALIDGGFSLFELSGVQSTSQVIELLGATGSPPPSTLRMAIVRVQ